MKASYEKSTIESEFDVSTYLERLKYALESGSATISFQMNRQVDDARDRKYTNRYTMHTLFPDEDVVAVLKRELATLTVHDYIETVKDTRYPKRSDMRVFGKKYSGEDVYIKIRVELVGSMGNNYVFVMSFHFAEKAFVETDFPYRKRGG
ncbi:hypothetical protein P22_2484 [Propionispora sp. 2/2-37]|uniref:hypothetical protein n=1 Tax=Propionispora sp. 2/2-37 TaxID=1677858 RepID=UPI0006BB59BF|nr:hypothetical protein [Propionispora sp. 2/2-37]CUH96394.1 hypothetical protein P22_2484 [Propionispora sp. 2/2-37]